PFVIVTLIWIMATGILNPSKETLPPVTDVLASIKELALSGQLATNVVASRYRLFLGSILGIVTGLIGGVIVGLNRKLAESLNPVVVFFNAISGIVWLPLMITWLGIGNALGGGRWQTMRSVILPGALPYILTGIRTGLGFGWRALIAAELVGAATGLGTMIFDAAEYHRSDIIVAGCLIIGVIAIVMDRWLLLPIERRTVR